MSAIAQHNRVLMEWPRSVVQAAVVRAGANRSAGEFLPTKRKRKRKSWPCVNEAANRMYCSKPQLIQNESGPLNVPTSVEKSQKLQAWIMKWIEWGGKDAENPNRSWSSSACAFAFTRRVSAQLSVASVFLFHFRLPHNDNTRQYFVVMQSSPNNGESTREETSLTLPQIYGMAFTHSHNTINPSVHILRTFLSSIVQKQPACTLCYPRRKRKEAKKKHTHKW